MAFDGRLFGGISVLAAVVETGNFVRAAEALGLTQSGISRGARFPRVCGRKHPAYVEERNRHLIRKNPAAPALMRPGKRIFISADQRSQFTAQREAKVRQRPRQD